MDIAYVASDDDDELPDVARLKIIAAIKSASSSSSKEVKARCANNADAKGGHVAQITPLVLFILVRFAFDASQPGGWWVTT